jgi:arsenate reductase
MAMNIVVFGRKSCKNTRKAERFFKERRISYHLRDLDQKPVSPGELRNLCSGYRPEDFIDQESKSYKNRGMAYMEYDAEEELLEDPGLWKTPIIRNGRDVTLGMAMDVWKTWKE